MGSTLFKSLLPSLQETIQQNVRIAIAEDIGSGDLTAQLIPSDKMARATIISRESAVICGIPWAEACFEQIVPDSITIWKVSEGDTVAPNQTLCEISGNARALLTAERSALNFLQAMSATATATRQFVDAVAGTSARIMDTRKTIPGMRLAQKYAVTVGGGLNQRMGLYDGILIKENHIAAAGSIEAVLKSAHDINSQVSIQIEVETLAQLATAIDAGAKLILLDNFSPELLCEAVKLNAKRAILEASGGISLENVREIALTGVDRISIGSLTKNIQAVDLSMRFAE
ncbi:MAG: carboxylating nicotinate-nucleotide diphosphorylase [Methylophilaceae bacterium]